MRVEKLLEASAARHPDKVALVTDEARVTYAELNATADRLAGALRRRGVGRGDRVVVMLDNSVETVATLFATLKAGAVFSVMNPTTKGEKLAYVLNNCRAAAVVTQERLLPMVAGAVAQAPSVGATVVAGSAAEPAVRGGVGLHAALDEAPAAPAAPVGGEGIDQDLAMVIYTSGSTGSPKGVMMAHSNILCATRSVAQYLELTPDDVLLCVLPLSFGYGLNQIFTSCLVGGTVVLEKSFAYPAATLQKFERERVTGFALVPTIAAILLMRNLTPGQFPNLRYITNAAAALPPAHIARLREVFPSTRLYSMYGQTECTRTLFLPPDQLDVRPGSIGKAIPNTEAWIVDETGRRVGPGEVGELVVRGGHVMRGYWENPEATERALRPGPTPGERVLHSGDLFRADDEGFLYFVSRKDDIIKTRGEKVSPKEVENVLYDLPGVREAAVIGVPDPILGQAIRAVVVLAEDGCLTDRQIIAHCGRHLEDFMVPRSVEFRAELPKTDSGKIRRTEVQAEALRALEAAAPA
ncbi:MAG TPA: AMP-binding protein [Fimbriiglobus sp.]|nr:AMP-binding protein [Fimbriiglobus sp.]